MPQKTELSREPGLRQALLTFSAIVLIIAFGLFTLSTSLHSLMLGCIIVATLSALSL